MPTYPRLSLFFVFLFYSLFSLQAQDTKAGGFTYGWDNYDQSIENGLGPRPVTFQTEGLRDITHAPEAGIHPRVFFGPSEISDLKDRLANTLSGQAIAAQIHAFTTLLHLGYSSNGTYSHNADYAKDKDGNRLIDNAGAWDNSPSYRKLVAEDPTVWEGQNIKTKHRTATLMALEAFECLLFAGQNDPDTGLSYDDRANTLAQAMNFWAGLALNNPDYNSDSDHFNHFGGTHMALCYDLLFNAMSTAQQDQVREALVKMIPELPRHGAYLSAYANTSNWTTLNSFEIIPNLAIEGEAGYKPALTERWMRTLHNFINYGWYPSGAGYEGLGKNYQYTTTMIACAKRGYSLLGHPHVKAYATEFLPAILQPFGEGFTSYDVWGGSGYDPVTGGYKFSAADAVGLKWVFPSDPKVDFVWRNYIETSQGLDSKGYVYQQVRPDDSYYNYLIPAAVFAQDYETDDWQTQADLTVQTDYFADDRGLAVLRSDSDKDAMAIQFHCRQDMGGHTHGDRNDFTMSALGRIWVRKSYSGSQFQPTWFHSTILVNDLGVPVGDPDGDKCRQPGKILHWESDNDLSIIAGDATYAYSWDWHWSAQADGQDHPWLGNDGWEKVTETWNDFQYSPQSETHFDLPFYDFPHWHVEGKFERMVKKSFNPMQRVIRSVAMVRTARPFALIVDDVQKNEEAQNYKWLAQIARDLTIKETLVSLDLDNYRNDIILEEPAARGNRRLLVRVLHNEGFDGTRAPGIVDTMAYNEYFNGTPYTPNPNWVRPRLIVESNSIAPDFKVMLFPFTEGDVLPITKWNDSKDTLSIINAGLEDVFVFEKNNMGRTEISKVPFVVNQQETASASMASVFPNPSSDFIQIDLKTNQSATFQLYDLNGKKVLEKSLTKRRTACSIASLATGIYFYEIRGGQELLGYGKLERL